MKKFWLLLSSGEVLPCMAKDLERAPTELNGLRVVCAGNVLEVVERVKEILHSKEEVSIEKKETLSTSLVVAVHLSSR